MTAENGKLSYSWQASNLPTGLTMNGTGTISGTPGVGTAGNSFNVSITVTDSSTTPKQDKKVYTLIITNGGNTITVTSTIASAISSANSGDKIKVPNGTYNETNIDFNGKNIHLVSNNGAKNCIIDCQNLGRAFFLHSGENSSAIIEGFTIINGKEGIGGAMNFTSASPTVQNCLIKDSQAYQSIDASGGGVYLSSSNAIFINCAIVNNQTMITST